VVRAFTLALIAAALAASEPDPLAAVSKPAEEAEADALLAHARFAWERIQGNVGRR